MFLYSPFYFLSSQHRQPFPLPLCTSFLLSFCIPKAHICGMACLWVAETVDVFKGKAQISPFLTWPLIDFFLAYSFYVILTSYFCFLIYQFIYCCFYPLPLAFTTLSAFILLVFPTLFTSLIRSFSFVCFKEFFGVIFNIYHYF